MCYADDLECKYGTLPLRAINCSGCGGRDNNTDWSLVVSEVRHHSQCMAGCNETNR